MFASKMWNSNETQQVYERGYQDGVAKRLIQEKEILADPLGIPKSLPLRYMANVNHPYEIGHAAGLSGEKCDLNYGKRNRIPDSIFNSS